MRTRHLIHGLVAAVALIGQQASAAVAVEAWYHLGESGTYTTSALDSSGKGRNISSAYSHVPPNNPAYGGNFMGIVSPGVGGPLGGTNGYTSTSSLRSGRWGTMICTMWGTTGNYNPPPTNYFIEIWVLPSGKGYVGGPCWIFTSGQDGGYALRVIDNGDDTSSFEARILGANLVVGTPVLTDTNKWTHLAIVNNAGTSTFYVNGVASGASDTSNATTPAGNINFGNPGSWQGFDGLIDEARICTFAPGQFSTNDFLLRPPGPGILTQPQSASVWEGGSAIFTVNAVADPALTYQWRRGGGNVGGATTASYRIPQVVTADQGAAFDCVLTNPSGSVTSSVATLTVTPVRTADVNAYRTVVTSEASLVAYFPADNDTGATLTNVKDATHNGTLELKATYDGRTNRAFGKLAVAMNADGDVQIPANPAFEFGTGVGTVEAIVHLEAGAGSDPTLFSVATDNGDFYYAIQVSKDGNSLVLATNAAVAAPRLSWPVPNLLGRLAHVALVFSNGMITPYVDGIPQAAKAQAFGPASGAPAWIGSVGTTAPFFRWVGSVDEVAIYNAALSMNTVQTHYSRFVYGTNVVAPSIVRQPSSMTLLAGASPVLAVQAAGTLPLNYQWKSNNVAIPGATSASLALNRMPVGAATYRLEVSNSVGTNQTTNIVLTFVAPPAGYATAVMNDGPTAYWRMDEAAGPATLDVAGGNHGVYGTNNVVYQAAGIPGAANGAVRFTGSPGRAVVPRSTVLNPSGPFTIEMWALPDPYTPGSTWSVPMSSMDRPARNGGYEFYMGGNYNGFEFHTAAAGGYNMITGDGTTAAQTWHHLVGVYDGTNIYCYVDGQPANPDFSDNNVIEGTAPYAANSVVDFVIGSRTDNVRYFIGSVDEVALYHYALTAQQVRNHMNAGLPLTLGVSKVSGLVLDTKPSGTLLHGLNNGATWVATSGNRSGVMQFVDTNTTQITVPAASAFDSTNGTIMFWMRSAGAVGSGQEGAMVFDRRGGSGNVIVLNNDGRLFIQPTGTGNSFYSASTVTNDTWTHVALTYDVAQTGTLAIYLNGVYDAANQNAVAWSWPAGQQVELGRSHDGYWRKFTGLLDDVRLYNRILTESEIAQAVAGNVVDPAALVARYAFDAVPGMGFRASWVPTYGTLQSAPTVPGTFTDIPGATSPYLVAPAGPQMYLRGKL